MTAAPAATFPGFPESVGHARRWVITTHGDGIKDDTLGDIGLMVSELITNSLRYSLSAGRDASVEVTVGVDDQAVTVQVIDEGSNCYYPEIADDGFGADETGRGLRIVEGLADEWGVRELIDGRRAVWFAVKL